MIFKKITYSFLQFCQFLSHQSAIPGQFPEDCLQLFLHFPVFHVVSDQPTDDIVLLARLLLGILVLPLVGLECSISLNQLDGFVF